MKHERFGHMTYRLLLAFTLVAAGVGQSAAQGSLRECPGTKDGSCVEILVRYYATPQKQTAGYGEPSKVVILDPQTKQELKACQICDPKVDPTCKNRCPGIEGTNIGDQSTLTLLQSHKSPGCYFVCSGGWCRWICF